MNCEVQELTVKRPGKKARRRLKPARKEGARWPSLTRSHANRGLRVSDRQLPSGCTIHVLCCLCTMLYKRALLGPSIRTLRFARSPLLSANSTFLARTMSSTPAKQTFVIWAPDQTDAEAFNRRLAVRATHLQKIVALFREGVISTFRAISYRIPHTEQVLASSRDRRRHSYPRDILDGK